MMANSRPPSIVSADAPDRKPSFFHKVSTKASRYHARVPYLQKLPFPVIAIIAPLIVVNLLVWAAVGIVLVCLTTPVPRAAG
jgi:high-affinity nickel-transport protein